MKIIFGGWKLSLSIILKIFLFFRDLILDDSYKIDSYKKSVYLCTDENNLLNQPVIFIGSVPPVMINFIIAGGTDSMKISGEGESFYFD